MFPSSKSLPQFFHAVFRFPGVLECSDTFCPGFGEAGALGDGSCRAGVCVDVERCCVLSVGSRFSVWHWVCWCVVLLSACGHTCGRAPGFTPTLLVSLLILVWCSQFPFQARQLVPLSEQRGKSRLCPGWLFWGPRCPGVQLTGILKCLMADRRGPMGEQLHIGFALPSQWGEHPARVWDHWGGSSSRKPPG